MQLVDTHCHVHSVDYSIPIADVDAHNTDAGVAYLIVVGCDAADSQRAVDFAADRPNTWAVVGQHPHEAQFGLEPLKQIRSLVEQDQKLVVSGPEGRAPWRAALRAPGKVALRDEAHDAPFQPSDAFSLPFSPSPARASGATAPASSGSDTVEGREGDERRPRRIVGIGECGLDYFYGHSSKEDQEKTLRYQIELALEFNLPLVFHVREAFDDFWPIFDSYQNIRGELHSYTDNSAHLSKAIERGLYIGVNGIMTFTKNDWQLEVARTIPLDKMLLETDAPFLTPAPLRGRVNEPAHVLQVATFISDLRQMPLSDLAQHTTTNARQLFSI